MIKGIELTNFKVQVERGIKAKIFKCVDELMPEKRNGHDEKYMEA